jgi:CRP-like cAMP-binding protein
MVTIRLVALLCERLRRATAMMEDVMFLNTGPRIAKALLRLAEEHGTRLADGMAIDVKINQTDLGFHVGVCREGVNRQLRQWQRAGIIGREEGRITIRQPTRLRSLTLSEA